MSVGAPVDPLPEVQPSNGIISESRRSMSSEVSSLDSQPLVLDIGTSDSEGSIDSIVSTRQPKGRTPEKIASPVKLIESNIQPIDAQANGTLPPVPRLRREGETGPYHPESKLKAIDYYLKHAAARGIDKRIAAEEMGVKYITFYQWVRDPILRSQLGPGNPEEPQRYTAWGSHLMTADAIRVAIGDTVRASRIQTTSPSKRGSHVGIGESVKRRRMGDPEPGSAYPAFYANSSSLGDMMLSGGFSQNDYNPGYGGATSPPRSRVGDIPAPNLGQPHIHHRPTFDRESPNLRAAETTELPRQLIRKTHTGGSQKPRQAYLQPLHIPRAEPKHPPPRAETSSPRPPPPGLTADGRLPDPPPWIPTSPVPAHNPNDMSKVNCKSNGLFYPGMIRHSTVDDASFLCDTTVEYSDVSNGLSGYAKITRSILKSSEVTHTRLLQSRVETSRIVSSDIRQSTVRASIIFDAVLNNCEVENSEITGGEHEGKIYHNVQLHGSDDEESV